MVLPKCNFLSSRPFIHFQDGCQNSPPQHTQEAHELVAQNQEDHRQQDTQQQQQQHNNNKEEEELFEDNIKDYNNNNNSNKRSSVNLQVRSEEGRVHTDFTLTLKKDNTKTVPTSPECVSSTRQMMMICPPAPKKKKTIQVTKRKLHHNQEDQRVFLDVYDEVESMFPPALLADLDNKIKKARKTTPIL